MNRRTFQALALSAAATRLVGAESQNAPRIKIGQVGTKHAHAGAQFTALRGCADFEVVGVVEPDEAQRQRMEKTADFAGAHWMTEDELFNVSGLQAVAVETEVGGLLDHAERVVNAGLHLHLDKPAGESLPRFQTILETATRKQRLVKMGYMFRFNPGFQLCFKAAKEGWLGRVFSLHGDMSKKIGPAERSLLLPYKGGSMFELGGHIIDAMVWMLGKPEKVTPFVHSFPHDGFNDDMFTVLQYPDATATVRVALMDGGPRRQFVACGDHGSCEIRPLEEPVMKLTLDQAQGGYHKGTQDAPLPKAPRHVADWSAFAKAIRGEMEWPWKPEHDLAVQETLLRASGLPIT